MMMSVFDLETTGLYKDSCDIIEVGIVNFDMESGRELEAWGTLVRPTGYISREIEELTGIKNDVVMREGKRWKEVAGEVYSRLSKADVWCAYNSSFDLGFIESSFGRVGLNMPSRPVVDPFHVAQRFVPYSALSSKSLGKVAAFFGVNLERAHRAVDDSRATGELLYKMCERIGVNVVDLIDAKPLCLGEFNIGLDPFEALYSGFVPSRGPR
jgi:DNA polymerase III alpha subunit (gram-positive type)